MRATRLRRARLGSVIYPIFLVLATLVLTEAGLRIYFAQRIGPRVLFYGTSWQRNRVERDRSVPEELRVLKGRAKDPTVPPEVLEAYGKRARWRSKSDSGYVKYFPNEVKFDVDPATEQWFRVGINSRGFRGKEFTETKAPGIVRVITLGASSTFGYYNRDETTYPAILEDLLNEATGGDPPFEVINLGIAHLHADEIAALFFAEGTDLEPDVVTFYEGNNDSGRVRAPTPPDQSEWLPRIGDYLLLAAFLRGVSTPEADKLLPADLQLDFAAASRRFLTPIQRIYDYTRSHDILFIVANQQKRSLLVDRSKIVGMTYAEEQDLVRKKALDTGLLTLREHRFLIHGSLMRDLEHWARKENVPFVDVIAAMDARRDYLVSAVHLTPEGNRLIAECLARRILQSFPPKGG